MVSSGEGWGVDRSNGRSYILGPAVNQDPGENIDKESGTIWPIDNVRATLTLSSLVTEGRTTLSNRAIQLHPKLILPC